MALIINTVFAVEGAAGASGAALVSNMDTTQAPGLRKYVYAANVATWIAQGIADTVFTANDVSFVFTAANHRLRTGMPVQVSNVGGGLPTGLSAATTYWVRVIDGNTFYLYDTQAHAIAGGTPGQVQVSSNGTGVQHMQTVATAGSGSLYVPASTQVILDGAYGAQLSVIDDGSAGKASIAPVVNVI